MSLILTTGFIVAIVLWGILSATLVLAMMSSGGKQNPPTRVKLLWGILVAGIAISLLLAGGIKALQTATIVFALPLAFVIPLMAWCLWRAVREDWQIVVAWEKTLRRRMEKLPVQ